MVLYGGLQYELNDEPIVEMSLSVTRVALFPFPVRSRRDIELPIFDFVGKPHRVAYGCDLFTRVFGQYLCYELFLIR